MKRFLEERGIVAPIDRAYVDTDAIIPKQYLKSIERTGFGAFLFDNWRYLDPGGPELAQEARRPNPDFVLNQPRYAGATLLLGRENFGCGSSREHAVWALDDYGIRAVIAPSFADIFYNNCFKSGLLPVILPPDAVAELFEQVAAEPGFSLTINLPEQRVSTPAGRDYHFEIDAFRKYCLEQGLDDIGLTLQHAPEIRAYEERRQRAAPWLFAEPGV